MKAVIFAGGFGTRISEESHLKPKPMIEIGGRPILWHILQLYAAHGVREFVICLGYRGYQIKEYFLNYYYHHADLTVDLATNAVTVHGSAAHDLRVTLVDTGLETQTAGRLQRVRPYVAGERFHLTYGDGLATIDLQALEAFHAAHGKTATLTAIQPGSRFGVLELGPSGHVQAFREKPVDDGNWINGGFFVLEPNVFDYLPPNADAVPWERAPLERLAAEGQLVAYRHTGFWKAMDTLRDRQELEKLWAEGAPWQPRQA